MCALREKLLAIWTEILQRPGIEVTDDFFDLGGTSLRLIRMVGRIRSELKLDVAYGDLVPGVTIESLVSMLKDRAGNEAAEDASSNT